jgi:hypothetical protein
MSVSYDQNRAPAKQMFELLNMKDTYFYVPPAKRDRLATVCANIDGNPELAPEGGCNGQGRFVDGPRKSFSGWSDRPTGFGRDNRLRAVCAGGRSDAFGCGSHTCRPAQGGKK